MKSLARHLVLLVLLTSFVSCRKNGDIVAPTRLELLAEKLNNYDSISHSKIMVVATHHFNEDILNDNHQKNISRIINALIEYRPTKIAVEWEMSSLGIVNDNYKLFFADSFDISSKANEVYQLGYRLAKKMNHDSLYVFDDQTEYIGSLENFSFDSFVEYAKANDDGFYNEFEKELIETFNQNQEIINNLNL